MKKIILVIFILASSMAFAEVELEGLFHEQFESRGDQGYGSQGAMIAGRRVTDTGIRNLTTTLRLATRYENQNVVYLPIRRSSLTDLERFIVRTGHSRSKLTMRPVIVGSSDLKLSERLEKIYPTDLKVWGEYYYQAIYPYLTQAARLRINDFVFATGMHHLWSQENAQFWIALAQKAANRLDGVGMSLEITSSEDLNYLATWKKDSPETFSEFSKLFKTIRMQINDRLPFDLSEWNRENLSLALSTALSQVREVFPGKPIRFANLTFPACNMFSITGESYDCFDGKWNNKNQEQAFKSFMDTLNNMKKSDLADLKGVELNMTVTQFEPEGEARDFRHFIFNPNYKKLIDQTLKSGKIWEKDTASTFNELEESTGELNACIFYNATDKDAAPVGEIHSLLMTNLMGAFPRWNARQLDINLYVKNDLDKCDAGFYIASNYFFQPNSFFLSDLARFIQKKHFVWFNYKFDYFQAAYTEQAKTENLPPFEFVYRNIHKPQDVITPDNYKKQGFYQYFEYKGEEFFKMAGWNYNTGNFTADPEIAIVALEEKHPNTNVLAWARHNQDGSKVPYVTHQKFGNDGGIFYFGDTPFSFIHYEDRYLILTDIMWDILKEEPPKGLRALARLEDIDGGASPNNLRWVIDYLADQSVPFSIAVIPIYSNVFGRFNPNDVSPAWTPLTQYPGVAGMLKYAQKRGADFIFHGVAHQGGDNLCGYDGNSGDDFEFWMYPENTPMPDDSVDFVTKLLDQGEKVFNELGIKPAAWETPHYANSALDSVIFGRTFDWTYHRPIYFPIKKISLPKRTPELYYFNCKTDECKKKQLNYLNKINIEVDSSTFSGQIFPYPVFKDVYGQRVIPETLGFVDHIDYNADTWRDVTSHLDILRRAKKLRVIRGAIASFFWHPHMLSPGSAARFHLEPDLYYRMNNGRDFIRLIIEGMKEMGYTFISINDEKIFPKSKM